MILIVSTETDAATLKVMHWLRHIGQPFVRINDTSLVQFGRLDIANSHNNMHLLTEDGLIDLAAITSYWYRRGCVYITHAQLNNWDVDKYIREDIGDIEEYLHFLTKAYPHINHLEDTYINKLICLHKAKSLDIDIPNTTILSNKQDVATFYYNNNKNIITKGIWNGYCFNLGGYSYTCNTAVFNYEALQEQIPERFFPTLFQEYTEKKYELRIFYLRGIFYSSAIFSQNDEQTKVDFRNYNTIKPNRINPYQLPTTIEMKLRKLMDAMQLNSGSIDMIYTPDGRYVFLEVNPIGQFAQVSEPCNYYLTKKIAEYLTQYNR